MTWRDRAASAAVLKVRLNQGARVLQEKSGDRSMLPSSARTLSRQLGRAVTQPPTTRSVYVYGLCAGLISGVLWTTMALVYYLNSLPETAIGPVLIVFVVAIDLTPIVLVAGCGKRLGRRNGSVRDGLIAGAVAGVALMVAYLVAVEMLMLHISPQEWHNLQNSPLRYLLGYAIFVLITGLVYVTVLAIAGSVGALVGRRWHRRGEEPWHESAGLAISAVSSIPDGSLAMSLGDDQPQEAERGRATQERGVSAAAVVLKGAYVLFQDNRRNLAMRFSPSVAPGRGFFGLPQSVSRGLSSGLFSGLLWALYAGIVRLSGPAPSSGSLLSRLIVPGLLLAPAFVVLVMGLRLGWRNGSVLDGLIAGLIASIAFTLIFSVTRLVVMWGQMVAEAHADHLPLWFELLVAIIMDVLVGAMFMFLGIGLGSLGALVGALWRRGGQLPWRRYVAFVEAQIRDLRMVKKPVEELPR